MAPALSTSFPALGDNDTAIPPDTMGAAGPSHLMTMLNSQVRIQTRTGADLGTVSLAAFWTAGTDLVGDPFDPKLVYDSLSGRWLATVDADGELPTSQVWFAISSTSDPTGAWSFFGFPADSAFPSGSMWADFPGLGVNSTWIAITNNMFSVAPLPGFVGAKMWVMDKASALAGGPLILTVFPAGFDLVMDVDGFVLQPAVTFDATEPKLYIVDNSGVYSGGVFLLRMSELTGTGPSPAWAPTAGGPFPGTGLFFVTNNFDFDQIGAPQQGVAATCDGGAQNGQPCTSDADCPPGLPTASCRLVSTNDLRILNAVFRNGRIWCTHSAGLPVDAVDRTAVFWYQIDPALMVTTGAPILQSGVLDGGAGVHHFFPSIAVNKNDDACIGFSRSDGTRFVEGVFTGRAGTDPPDTMAPIAVLKAGEDSYLKDFGFKEIRWGDYSATVVDPTDDETFWTIQEYAAMDVGSAPDDDRWGTWWGSIVPESLVPTVPSCGPAVLALLLLAAGAVLIRRARQAQT
jgi:hypothetical protein